MSWLRLAVTASVAGARARVRRVRRGRRGRQRCRRRRAEVTKVTVGTLPISNAAPLYLGAKKGFFREEGIEVKPEVAQSGNELITGALSGLLRLHLRGLHPVDRRAFQGPADPRSSPPVTSAPRPPRKEWTVLLVKKPESKIRGPDDLVGKTIAVNGLRGVGEVVIKASLEKQGVDPDRIELLEVPFPEMPAALESGPRRRDLGARAVPHPGGSTTAAARSTRRSSTIAPNFVNGAYEASEGVQFSKNPKVTWSASSAPWTRSVDYAQANPGEGPQASIPTFTKIPPEVADKIRLPVWPVPIDTAKVTELGDYAVKYGVVEKAPSMDELHLEGGGDQLTVRRAGWVAPLVAVAVVLLLMGAGRPCGRHLGAQHPDDDGDRRRAGQPGRRVGLLDGGRPDPRGLGPGPRHGHADRDSPRHPHRLGVRAFHPDDRVPAADPVGGADPAHRPRLRGRPGRQGVPGRVRPTWPILLQTLYGVRDVDPVATETARSFGISRPSGWAGGAAHALPYIVTGLRISSAVALILAVTVELVLGEPGLGQEMNIARQSAAVPQMYALIVMTGLIGWLLNIALSMVERRVLHWHASQRERPMSRGRGTGLVLQSPCRSSSWCCGGRSERTALVLLPAARDVFGAFADNGSSRGSRATCCPAWRGCRRLRDRRRRRRGGGAALGLADAAPDGRRSSSSSARSRRRCYCRSRSSCSESATTEDL